MLKHRLALAFSALASAFCLRFATELAFKEGKFGPRLCLASCLRQGSLLFLASCLRQGSLLWLPAILAGIAFACVSVFGAVDRGMALFGIGFSVLVALFALRRASKIFFWLRLDGVVVGPLDGVGDTSAVVIKFTDPDGNAREFPSSLTYGHRYRAPLGERIPYSPGDRVSILVNPRNYLEADLNSPLLIVIPVLLLLLSAALASTLL